MESPLRPPSDPGFRLIETFGYVPAIGCRRIELHLGRMAASASAFGISFDPGQARCVVERISGDQMLRCRLTLDCAGLFDLTTAHMGPAVQPWRLGIAKTRLDSGDPWLLHKTTMRALYDQARSNLPEGVDELIFLNERDEVCEGTITNIFVSKSDGTNVTPPLSCGVLPGVLRQSELGCGRFEEAVVTVDALCRARWLRVGNSLRGMMSAELV